MRRRTFNKLLGTGIAAAALGRYGIARAADPFKAGFIYVGPVADYGFSHQHDVGRQAAQTASLVNRMRSRSAWNSSARPGSLTGNWPLARWSAHPGRPSNATTGKPRAAAAML